MPTGASSLNQGDVLGRYRILYKIGAGGMGEVYAVEDTRLSRKVALKILPPDVAHNQERRARFEREARSVAALNHPNIVTVHAVEELEGRLAIVMELVEGKTLAELLPRGGMALPQLLDVALPLVQAVSAAHQSGITHRDLKPQNVMVTTDGRVKVLDFGLAKMSLDSGDRDVAQLPTASVTAEGKLVGTVAYMSPEQAQGKKVDVRTDVFALGVVLFELATGQRPFQGETPVSILSAILKDEPPSVSRVRHDLPLALDRVLRRCLAKDPLKRYQTAIDLLHDLEELRNPAPPRGRVPIWRALVVLALLVVGAVFGLKIVQRSRGVGDGPRVASLMHLTSAPDLELSPSVAPDGTWFVYASRARGNWDIYRQRIGGENPQNLTADSDSDDTTPAISPDGERIAFHSERGGGGLFLMGATGESVRKLADVGYDPSFTPDGTKVVVSTIASVFDPRFLGSSESSIWLIDVESGEKRRIVAADKGMRPVVAPSGNRIAFWRVHEGGMRDLYTAALDGGAAEELTHDRALDYDPVWSPDGSWLYFASDRGGNMNLWRLPVDGAGRASGPPDWVTDGAVGWSFSPAFSRDGQRMAFVAGGPSDRIERIAFDPVKEEVVGQPVRLSSGFAPAVVGQELVYFATEPHEDVLVARTDGTARRRLTDDAFRDRVPRLSPDGQRVAFYSDRSGTYELWSERLDGSGLTQLTSTGHLWYPLWSPDGKRMAGCSLLGSWIFDPNQPWAKQTPQKLAPLADGRVFCGYDWSPDGRLLIGSAASDQALDEIWTFEPATRKYRQVIKTGEEPRWLSDSRRALFHQDGKILLLDTVTGRIKPVFDAGDGGLGSSTPAPDDRALFFEHHVKEADVWLATFKR